MSFAAFFTVILVRVLTRPCFKSTRFTNSFKVVAGYIALVLIVIIYTAVVEFRTLSKHQLPGHARVSVTVEGASDANQDLYYGVTSIGQVICNGIEFAANWSLSFLFFFTVLAMNFSLKWE